MAEVDCEKAAPDFVIGRFVMEHLLMAAEVAKGAASERGSFACRSTSLRRRQEGRIASGRGGVDADRAFMVILPGRDWRANQAGDGSVRAGKRLAEAAGGFRIAGPGEGRNRQGGC